MKIWILMGNKTVFILPIREFKIDWVKKNQSFRIFFLLKDEKNEIRKHRSNINIETNQPTTESVYKMKWNEMKLFSMLDLMCVCDTGTKKMYKYAVSNEQLKLLWCFIVDWTSRNSFLFFSKSYCTIIFIIILDIRNEKWKFPVFPNQKE
mgnify:CR=1 FL=1